MDLPTESIVDIGKVGGGMGAAWLLQLLFAKFIKRSEQSEQELKSDLHQMRELMVDMNGKMAVLLDRNTRQSQQLEKLERDMDRLQMKVATLEALGGNTSPWPETKDR